jgi:hypothetical protein
LLFQQQPAGHSQALPVFGARQQPGNRFGRKPGTKSPHYRETRWSLFSCSTCRLLAVWTAPGLGKTGSFPLSGRSTCHYGRLTNAAPRTIRPLPPPRGIGRRAVRRKEVLLRERAALFSISEQQAGWEGFGNGTGK